MTHSSEDTTWKWRDKIFGPDGVMLTASAVLHIAGLVALVTLLRERGLLPADPWLSLAVGFLVLTGASAFAAFRIHPHTQAETPASRSLPVRFRAAASQILESCPVGLALVDQAGQTLWRNAAMSDDAGGEQVRVPINLGTTKADAVWSPSAPGPDDNEWFAIEKILQHVLTSSLIGASIQDDNWNFLFANEKVIKMFGFDSLEGLQNANMDDTYAGPKERKSVLSEVIERAALGSGGAVIGYEVLRRRVDGSAWWALMNTVTLRRRDGKRYWVTWLVDITDRKEAEARLRESEQQLRRILESSPNGIIIEERDGTAVYTNRRALALFGAASDAEFHARDISETYVDVADYRTLRAKLSHPDSSSSMEIMRRRLDGSEWWCRVDCVSMKLKHKPVVVHWLYDVTSAKNLRDEIERKSAILELTMQNMAQAIAMYDSSDRLVAYNDRFAKLFEVPCEDLNNQPGFAQLIGKLPFERDWPGFDKCRPTVSERVKDFELLQSLLAERQKEVLAWSPEKLRREIEALRVARSVSYERLRGGCVWLETRSNFLGDGSVVCTYTDITERKLVESQIRKSEHLLQEIIDAIPIYLSLKDRSLRYLLINQGTADLFGVAKEEPINGRLGEFIDDPRAQVITEADRRILDGLSPVETFEAPLLNAQGEERLMQFSKQPLLDANDGIYAILTVCYDITELRSAEGALKESEALLRSVVNASTAAISVQDQTQRFIFVNDLFLQYYGLRRDEVLGGGPAEVLGKEIGPRYAKLDRRVLETADTVQDVELEDSTRGPSQYWLINKDPIKNAAGQVEKVVTVALDITARKHAEKEALRARDAAECALADLRLTQEHLIQSEKMASLGNLVAAIAHEINTPIGNALLACTHLSGKVEQLMSEPEDAPGHEAQVQRFLEVARESTRLTNTNIKRAAELIRNFKQVAVDRSSNQLRSFNVRDYVYGIIDGLKPQLRASQPQITLECPGDLEVLSYPGVISQIVSNLIINSVVHGFANKPGGHIEIAVEQPGQAELLLQVRDDGRGIPEEIRDKIFEPFFTTARSSGGSGLGLHIIYNLVTQTLGGRIELAPGSEHGCCFTVFIPVEVSAERQTAWT